MSINTFAYYSQSSLTLNYRYDRTSTQPVEKGLRDLNLNTVRKKLQEHQKQQECGNTKLNRNTNYADEDCGFASCDSDMSLPSSQESVSSNESSPFSSMSSCDEESSDNRLQCKVCMDKKLEVVFIPCGHFVCCSSCAQSLSKCPYCRKVISSAVKTYLS